LDAVIFQECLERTVHGRFISTVHRSCVDHYQS
jgi:hypothetical protein